MFRGREITHAQLGWRLLEKMMEALKGTVIIEKQPIMEGSRMFMILSPMTTQQVKSAASQQAKSSIAVAAINTQSAKSKEEKVKESANA